MLTQREIAKQKAQTRREMIRDTRIRDRAKLKELRAHIAHAKKLKRVRLAQVREICKRGRLLARERGKIVRMEIRAAAKLAAQRAIQDLRSAARDTCEARKAQAREQARDSAERAQHVYRAERQYQDEIRRLSRGTKATRKQAALRVAEHRRESDDEVRGSIDAELVPVFDRLKHKFKDEPRRTRLEAFTEWAHSHPAQVREIIDEEIESSIRELVRAEKKQRSAMKRPYRSLSDAELDRRFSAAAPELVPF